VNQQEKPLSEFRQFWIYYFSSGRAQISTSVVTLDDEYISEPNQTRGIKPTEVKHVIEYAAVAEVTKRERERAKVLVDFINTIITPKNWVHTVHPRCLCDECKPDNERALIALSKYQVELDKE